MTLLPLLLACVRPDLSPDAQVYLLDRWFAAPEQATDPFPFIDGQACAFLDSNGDAYIRDAYAMDMGAWHSITRSSIKLTVSGFTLGTLTFHRLDSSHWLVDFSGSGYAGTIEASAGCPYTEERP